VSGPAGEAAGQFRLPYSDVELENLVLKLSRPRSAVRRLDSPELELVRDFGGSLFESLFSGRVRDVYRSSLASAQKENCGLRISLALTGTPELMPLPWEYLYDDPAFLSISTWTPVVRYLDLPASRRPLLVQRPLRILGMVSSPSDVVELDVGQERQKLEEALAPLVAQGGVQVRWLEQATLKALQRELRRDEYHIFHYIGHGGYDRATDDGMLVLEDEDGRSRLVSGPELATLLADETSLRLAVLNACEGARSSVSDPFSGVASSLVRREIPAVIAMQLEITDRAAITFASELYSALADGYAVDAALAEARKAIYADRNDVEWATPVLFMRVPDGRIFDIAEPLGVHQPIPEVVPKPPIVDDEVKPWPTTTKPPPRDVPDPLPPVDVPPEAVPARVMVLLGAATALLALGLVYPWDHHRGGRSYFHPYFGRLSNAEGGAFTALSPLALLVMAAAACWLARRGRLQLAAGLLLGCGLAAAAKYLGLLARIVVPANGAEPVRVDSAVVFAFVLFGAFALVPAAVRLAQLAHTPLVRRDGRLNVAVAVGAMLVIVGCLLPFNGGGHDPAHYRRAILPDEGSQAIEPLVLGIALVALVLVLRYLPLALAAGCLIALGIDGVTLWIRYAGIPVVEDQSKASAAAGGFVGIAGGVVALVIGLRLLRTAPEQPISSAAAWTT
jgi:CHAT domain-containing protein